MQTVSHKQKTNYFEIKMKYFTEDIIDGTSIDLNSWLELVFSSNDPKVFPNNCFPSNKMLDEYLGEIESKTELEIRNILRIILVKTCSFGNDDFYRKIAIMGKTKSEIIEEGEKSEYFRKLISKGPTHDGITWILDLLPSFPKEALNGLNAYFQANCLTLPDNAIFGLDNALSIIRARYINYEHPQDIYLDLTPLEFEKLVESLYISKGYKTTLTKHSHDGGVDIIAEKLRSGDKEKLIIQCKRYTKKITVKEVRELSGVISNYAIKKGEKITKGVLVTSSEFTRSAIKEFANDYTIELIDYKEMSKQLNLHEGRYWQNKIDRLLKKASD